MKWFWLLIAAMLIAAIALVFGRRDAASVQERLKDSEGSAALTPERTPELLASSNASPQPQAASIEASATSVPPAPGAPPVAALPPVTAAGRQLDDMLFGPQDAALAGGSGPAAAAIPSIPIQPPAPAQGSGNGPATVVKQADGTTLVDSRFSISGSGTKEAPFVVPWSYLVSAEETYQPRLGRKNLPDRMSILNGKWVTLSGYIAFPIMAATPDEMLMMLNQWDGCCLGVPPTPYDAIEVKLSTPATRAQRTAVDGTVTGILRVDPYLVKDWLVSLFLMDDATLTRDSATGPERATRDPSAHAPGALNGGKSSAAPPTPTTPPQIPKDGL